MCVLSLCPSNSSLLVPRVFEQDGVGLVCDDISLEFLGDCDVDYTSEMIRASFQVVKNSSADAGCGCGASFSVSAGF